MTTTPPLVTPRNALPKLTKPEMARLVEIGRDQLWGSKVSVQPATTNRLRAKGLVRTEARARGSYAVLTPAGRDVLAGLPERTP